MAALYYSFTQWAPEEWFLGIHMAYFLGWVWESGKDHLAAPVSLWSRSWGDRGLHATVRCGCDEGERARAGRFLDMAVQPLLGTPQQEQEGSSRCPWNRSPYSQRLVKPQDANLSSWKGLMALLCRPRCVPGMGLTFTQVALFTYTLPDPRHCN